MEELVQNILYYWSQYFSKIDFQGFDMISVILFLHDIKPWLLEIEGLESVSLSIINSL